MFICKFTSMLLKKQRHQSSLFFSIKLLNCLTTSASKLTTKKEIFLFFLSFFFFFCRLGPHQWPIEAPRLGVELELQLPAYTMATARRNQSCICYLCYLQHSSMQCQICYPLSEARDQIHVLMTTSYICFCCATT